MDADEDGLYPFPSVFIRGLRIWPSTAGRLFVLVAAVAVDLAADFAAWPGRAVNVHISGAGSNSPDQLVNLSGIQTLISRGLSGWDVGTDISCDDGTRYRGGRCWAGLS